VKSKVNCITINTDASFCPDQKVGGYAFYIVCDCFKIQKSGMFKSKLSSSLDAEMKCMANALYMLSNQKELPEANIIVINSDCLMSFEKITRKSLNLIGRKVANYLRSVRLKTSMNGVIMPKYEFRHVKAHNGTNDARSWVNDWCDKEAKKWMKKARELKPKKS
jgi:ribonuclease HI